MTARRERNLWLAAWPALIVAVFARYWPFLTSPFWADDKIIFLARVQAFQWRLLPELVSATRGWFYRPTFLVYFSLMRRVFGDNATAMHACSFILHATNIWLVVVLMRRLTGSGRETVLGATAAAVALLFHPRLAQSPVLGDGGISAVVWISSASTLLAAFFALLTFHAWLTFRRTGRAHHFGAALTCFLLSLCSKEDAATLLLALLALDVWWWRDSAKKPNVRQLAIYAPFVAAFALFVVLDITAYRNFPHRVFGGDGTGGIRQLTRYRLAVDFFGHSLYEIWSGGAMWVVVGAGALLVFTWRNLRAAAFFWLWAFSLAFPTTLTSGPHALASRFYYLPALAGVSALALTVVGARRCDRAFFIALTAALVVLIIPIEWTAGFADPFVAVLALAIVAAAAWRLDHTLFWPLIIGAVGSQGEIWFPAAGSWQWPAAMVLAVLAATRLRLCEVAGVLAVSFSMTNPPLYWMLFVTGGAWPVALRYIQNRKLSEVP